VFDWARIAALAGPRCPPRPLEDEAQSAAAQVLFDLSAGRSAGGARGSRPAAGASGPRELRCAAAQGRRRTGWRLSTTRAAAGFMALLHSARHDAGNDALLDY
jgi:ATP-dependent helicase/nuclease subunit B